MTDSDTFAAVLPSLQWALKHLRWRWSQQIAAALAVHDDVQ